MLSESLKYKQKEVLEHSAALGRFSIWLKKRFPDIIKQGLHEGEEEHFLEDNRLDEIIEELRKKKRLSNPADLKARVFAVHQLKARGFSIQEIVDSLEISKATVYNCLKNTETQPLLDK